VKEFAGRVDRNRTAVRAWIKRNRVEAIARYNGKTRWLLIHEREVERMERELARPATDRFDRPEGGPWLTAREVAAELGLQQVTIHRHMREGIIHAIKIHAGGRWRYRAKARQVV
jgi:predicted site-specific integrase-resolvase